MNNGVNNKQKKDAKNNMLIGVCALLFALIYYLETFQFRAGNKNVISITTFPRIVGAVIGVCGIMMLWRGYKGYRKIPEEICEKDNDTTKILHDGLIRVIEVMVVLLITAAGMKPLGFLIVVPVMMFALFVILEKPDKRRYVFYAIAAIVAPVLVYFSFYYFFSSLLPMGILKPVLAQVL